MRCKVIRAILRTGCHVKIIKAYLYIVHVIAGAVGGYNRLAVNLKQCSRRGLNYQGEYGLVFVRMFVIVEKQCHLHRQCRYYQNEYVSNICLLLQKTPLFGYDFPFYASFTFMFHSTLASSITLCRPIIFLPAFLFVDYSPSYLRKSV